MEVKPVLAWPEGFHLVELEKIDEILTVVSTQPSRTLGDWACSALGVQNQSNSLLKKPPLLAEMIGRGTGLGCTPGPSKNGLSCLTRR